MISPLRRFSFLDVGSSNFRDYLSRRLTDCVVHTTVEGNTLFIQCTRGAGKGIKVARAKVDLTCLDDDATGDSFRNALKGTADSIIAAAWLWDRPDGLVVAQAGRWRKWGRAR